MNSQAQVVKMRDEREVKGSKYTCPLCGFGLRRPSSVLLHLHASHRETWAKVRSVLGDGRLSVKYPNDGVMWTAIKAAVAA